MNELGYNHTKGDTTNTFLIESLQNLKYYINNFTMTADFDLIVNFTGLLDTNQISRSKPNIDVVTYKSHLNVSSASLAVSQKYSVSDEGDLEVKIPLISFNLQPENLHLVFEGEEECDFIKVISGTFNKTKEFVL